MKARTIEVLDCSRCFLGEERFKCLGDEGENGQHDFMTLGFAKKQHIVFVVLFTLSSQACSFRNRNPIEFSHRMEPKNLMDEGFQLPEGGPKFKLLRSGESYFYRLNYEGRELDIESYIRENPATGGPVSLEITFSRDFKHIVIREDLTDAAPDVGFVYLSYDIDGFYKILYLMPPVRRFDSGTPLGVEFPRIESIYSNKVVLSYKIANRRDVINIGDIECAASAMHESSPRER